MSLYESVILFTGGCLPLGPGGLSASGVCLWVHGGVPQGLGEYTPPGHPSMVNKRVVRILL